MNSTTDPNTGMKSRTRRQEALTRLFDKWRQVTEREGWAILSEDWRNLSEQQEKKQRLRLEISRALDLICASQPSRAHLTAEDQRRFDSIVSELVALETRNRNLLSAKCQSKQAELQRLNAGVHNLHRPRRAYGTDFPRLWPSCS